MTTVRYMVKDVDASVAFYTTQLDFTVKQQFGPNIAILTRDGLTLWVAGPNASAGRPMPDGRVPEPGGWNRFVLEVKDLPDMVARLRQNGAHFRNDIVEGPGGQADPVRRPFRQCDRAVRAGPATPLTDPQ